MESQAFFGGLIHAGGGGLYESNFVPGFFHTCYLYLKKEE